MNETAKQMIKFEASLGKLNIDKEGEVRLTLIVPKKYKNIVINIPEEKSLAVGITEFEVSNE